MGHQINMRVNSEYEEKNDKPSKTIQTSKTFSILKQKKLLKCEYCSFKSVQLLLLNKHKRKIHGSTMKGMKCLTCNYCNMRFSSTQVLNEHKTKVHNVVRA